MPENHERPPISNAADGGSLNPRSLQRNGNGAIHARLQRSTPTLAEIKDRACEAAFGRPLITNSYRGLIVEAIIASALEPNWKWCGADYWGWDFERDGIRLEVRQTAARQTWERPDDKPSNCRFDIKARKGRYEGAVWFESMGRAAHVYVLAHHPIEDDSADHRDPRQWRFFVLPAYSLPRTGSIGVRPVASLANACSFINLAATVDQVATALSKP